MDPKEFEELLSQYRKIKDNCVDERLKFYKERVESKRHAAERSRTAILLLSLVIPIVANLDFTIPWLSTGIIVSIMSLLIAFLSGLGELHQWQHTWQEYSKAIVQIEALIGSWEIEVAGARQLSQPKEISDKLAKATHALLESVEQIVLIEMRAFFATTPKAPSAQQDVSEGRP